MFKEMHFVLPHWDPGKHRLEVQFLEAKPETRMQVHLAQGRREAGGGGSEQGWEADLARARWEPRQWSAQDRGHRALHSVSGRCCPRPPRRLWVWYILCRQITPGEPPLIVGGSAFSSWARSRGSWAWRQLHLGTFSVQVQAVSLQCEQSTVQANLKGLFTETVFLRLLSPSPASLRSSGLWGWGDTYRS